MVAVADLFFATIFITRLILRRTHASKCQLGVNNICFVHQTGGNQMRATEEVTKSVRKHYKTSPYVLISDGGGDMSDMCSNYNVSFVCDHKIFNRKPPGYFSSSKNCLQFLHRVQKAITSYCGRSEYVVFLEDDTICNRRVRTCPPFDGNGLILTKQQGRGKSGLSESFLHYVKVNNKNSYYDSKNFKWGLPGGAFIRISALLNLSFSELELDIWREKDPVTVLATDSFFTASLLAGGFSVGGWNELTQDPAAWKAGAFEHSVKKYYSKSSSIPKNCTFNFPDI
jgi:hypothetical protein